MSKELAKTYDPKGLEDRIYQKWLDNKYFHAEVNRDKKPFTIVMPPPNVTGQLHMGHALDETMQDILIRFKRMQGYEALWQPGTDHASIATEVKVIEKLKEQGIDKNEIGREAFLKHAWEWKEEYGGKIINQLKKLGASADWDRERFTMDEGSSWRLHASFKSAVPIPCPCISIRTKSPAIKSSCMPIKPAICSSTSHTRISAFKSSRLTYS